MQILIADKPHEFVIHSLEDLGFAVFMDSSLKESLLNGAARQIPTF